jgi:hypothetical protein
LKFIDTRGREHKVDIRPSRWKKKEVGSGRGLFQSKVGDILEDKYPADIILEEFPCSGEGLFLDFFLPRSKIAVEVQGPQHKKFVAFFHNTKADFQKQVQRDKRKESWCEINEIRLIKIDWGEKEENIKNVLD